MLPLDQRHILITGAGRGYGARAAHILTQEGAQVCIVDLNPDRIYVVEKSIEESGGTAVAIQGDVSNKFQAAHMIEATRDHLGSIDTLIMNAHVSPKDSFLKMDEWNWRRSLEVNVTGAFFTAQFAARVMADEEGGDIVFLLRSGESVAFQTAQSALRGLADGIQNELADQGVRIHMMDLASTDDFEAELIKLLLLNEIHKQ